MEYLEFQKQNIQKICVIMPFKDQSESGCFMAKEFLEVG